MCKVSKNGRHLHRGMFFFAVLLVTVALIGCGDGGSVDPVKTELEGNFAYLNISTAVGTETTSSPAWTGEGASQTVEYSITPALPDGITMDTSTGVVTVSATAAVQTEYTVTATGTDDYKGEVTAPLYIAVEEATAEVIAGTLSYSPTSIATPFGTPTSASPTYDGGSTTGTARYSISPALPDGINFGTSTGEIAVSVTAVKQDKTEYTVSVLVPGSVGTVTTIVSITVGEGIKGELTYSDIITAFGTEATSSPAWDEEGEGQTVEYSINSTQPDEISIDTSTGVVTVSASVAVQAEAVYTVTATGTGNYAGIIEGTINISVNAKDLSGELSYNGIVTGTGSVSTFSAIWTTVGQTVEYSINPALPDGIAIDASTGTITVSATATVQAETEYRVTATGTGNYAGTQTATVSITVKKGIEGTFTYSDIITAFGTEATSSPTWAGEGASQTVEYSINSTQPDEISIDTSTGEVTASTTATVQAETVYTVTATGTGDNAGIIEGTINITVNAKEITGVLSYENIRTAYGSEASSPAIWSSEAIAGQTAEYTIAPELPVGITMDADTGTIIVSATATGQHAGTEYTVTATATGNYKGETTATIKLEVIMPDSPPGVPTITDSPIPGDAQATIRWTAPTETGYNDGVVATITGYTVYYSSVQGFTKDNATGNKSAGATATEIVVDDLPNDTTYYFLVTAKNDSGEGESSEITVLTVYSVGDTGPAGGIVFYAKPAYSDGWRYMEAATSDQGTKTRWWQYSATLVGTSTGIGTGQDNTEKIVNKYGLDYLYAALICYVLELGGYNDWFLPSRDELNALYEQRADVGNFKLEGYWSSSELSSDMGYFQNFENGTQETEFKAYFAYKHVRAVRDF